MDRLRPIATICLAFAFVLFAPEYAYASGGSDLPWNSPLTNILNNLQGPTASVIMTLAIVASALMLMFSQIGALARAVLTVVIAAAAATKAPELLSTVGISAATI